MTKDEMTLVLVAGQAGRQAGTEQGKKEGRPDKEPGSRGAAAAGRLWDPPIDRMGTAATDDGGGDGHSEHARTLSLSLSGICYAN